MLDWDLEIEATTDEVVRLDDLGVAKDYMALFIDLDDPGRNSAHRFAIPRMIEGRLAV